MEAILSGIFGLIGVAVGFLLGEWKKREEDKKTQENLRLMLHYEIEQNLTILKEAMFDLSMYEVLLLKEYWDAEKEYSSQEREAQERQVKSRVVKELNNYPFPKWRKTVWEAQTASIAGALNQNQVISVLGFYSELDKITEIRTLVRLNEQEQLNRGTLPPSTIGSSFIYHESVQNAIQDRRYDLWYKFDQAVKKIRGIGNPLAT